MWVNLYIWLFYSDGENMYFQKANNVEVIKTQVFRMRFFQYLAKSYSTNKMHKNYLILISVH